MSAAIFSDTLSFFGALSPKSAQQTIEEIERELGINRTPFRQLSEREINDFNENPF